MDFYTFAIALLVVGLFAIMSADIILDMQSIWNGLETERGSGRIEKEDYPEKPRPNKIATLDWVQVQETEVIEEVVDVIQLAKSRQPKTVIQAGTKVRELLDSLGKSVQQLVDYSSMNIRQLKALASQFKIKGYGKMKKAELIFALESMS